MMSHGRDSSHRPCLVLQRKSTHVTRRGRVPWRRPGRTPGRALSSQSAPRGGSISRCSATSPRATAGVCWWTRGARCLGPPHGKSPRGDPGAREPASCWAGPRPLPASLPWVGGIKALGDQHLPSRADEVPIERSGSWMLGDLGKVGSLSEPQFTDEKAIALPESLGSMDQKRSRVQTYGAISMLKRLKGHVSVGTLHWGCSVRLLDRAGGTSLPALGTPGFPTAQIIAAVVAEVPSSRIISLFPAT